MSNRLFGFFGVLAVAWGIAGGAVAAVEGNGNELTAGGPEVAAAEVQAPRSMVGKRIRFIYSDTRYREGEFLDGEMCTWKMWQTGDLRQADVWVGHVSPETLDFPSADKAVVKPVGVEGGFMLVCTYAPAEGNTAVIRRELAFTLNELGEESGEYALTFDSPTGGTAALIKCFGGDNCFECENIKFVIEELSEEELSAHAGDAAPTVGGLSSAEKAELEDFLETLVMVSSRSSSATKLYQARLLMLLPMIQEGAPVDVTTPLTKGNTALHYACGMGRLDIVEWLVKHGADVNKRTDKGASPLNCVSGMNGPRIRSFLIQHGAVR